MPETQKSIYDWTVQTFPKVTKHGRMAAIIEETIELAVAEGLTSEEIADFCGAALTRCEEQAEPGSIQEEASDLQICLYAYAGEKGIDVVDETEQKMAKNRSRPQSYYDEKQAAKLQNGTRIPE